MLKRMDCHGQTDIGRSRKNNEDQFLIADLNKSMRIHATSLHLEAQTRLYGGSQGKLLLVADGMGGHTAGDRASSIALDSIAHYVLNAMHWMFQLDRDPEADFIESLKNSIRHTQERILDEARMQPHRKGMGTTVTMAYLIWPRLYVVHVGDSRCYLFRNQTLKQLTRDHNLAERMVEEGAMSPEEVRHSRWQHVVWNVLGGPSEDLTPEVGKTQLQTGDCILLCSDGLTKHVSDQELARTLSSNDCAKRMCQTLIDRANQAGGTDNITVVIAKFHSPDDQQLEEEAEAAAEPSEEADPTLSTVKLAPIQFTE